MLRWVYQCSFVFIWYAVWCFYTRSFLRTRHREVSVLSIVSTSTHGELLSHKIIMAKGHCGSFLLKHIFESQNAIFINHKKTLLLQNLHTAAHIKCHGPFFTHNPWFLWEQIDILYRNMGFLVFPTQFRAKNTDDYMSWHSVTRFHGVLVDYRVVDTSSMRKVRNKMFSSSFLSLSRFLTNLTPFFFTSVPFFSLSLTREETLYFLRVLFYTWKKWITFYLNVCTLLSLTANINFV